MIAGIVVALPEELSTLTAKKIAKGCCSFIANNIVVAYSGAGGKNAEQAAQLLVSEGATCLISWGCAAALADSLKSGDLTLPTALFDTNHVQLDLNSDWHKYAETLLSNYLPVHTGTLLESKEIVSSSRDKKQLHVETAAVVLDMETVAVAKVARKNNLPFLAIRAIADPVTMDLPKAIAYSLNDEGEVMMGRLLWFLLGHPLELPGLIKLGLHFNVAKKTLLLVATQLDILLNFHS